MITSLLFRAVAWIASIVIAFANLGAIAEKPGTPAWNEQTYLQKLDRGTLKFAPKWDITFDDTLMTAFDDLELRTGMDLPAAVAGLRDLYSSHRWMVKLFPGIFYGLRDRWLDKGDYWEQNGDGNKMVIYRILGICVGMPTKSHIVAEPTDDPDVFEVFVDCTYADGSVRRLRTYSKYNKVSGEFGDGNGISGLGFNFNFNDAMAYTAESWQRGLGYMKLYDTLLLKTTKMVNVDTVRLKFPYDGKDWMLQLWKGRYFTTTGGEIGIYNKPKSRLVEFYDAANDDQLVYMSFKITANDAANGNPVIIDRPVALHWWMTGFGVNRYAYTPDRLTLGSIFVPTDSEMYDALKIAMDREKVSYAETEWDNPETVVVEQLPALEITW